MLVYAWDSEKRNFDSFVCQVHVKKLTNKTDFEFDFDQSEAATLVWGVELKKAAQS